MSYILYKQCRLIGWKWNHSLSKNLIKQLWFGKKRRCIVWLKKDLFTETSRQSPDGTNGLALTEWPTSFSLDSNSILWETPVTGRQKASFGETFLWCSNSDCFPSFHQIITDRIEYKTHSLDLTKSLAILSPTQAYSLNLTKSPAMVYHWQIDWQFGFD